MLHIEEFIDSLHDAAIFSTSDAKLQILAGRNRRIGAQQEGISLPPWLILLYTNAIWAQERPRDVSMGNGRPTDEWKMPVALVHFDDIMIFWQTRHEHTEHV